MRNYLSNPEVIKFIFFMLVIVLLVLILFSLNIYTVTKIGMGFASIPILALMLSLLLPKRYLSLSIVMLILSLVTSFLLGEICALNNVFIHHLSKVSLSFQTFFFENLVVVIIAFLTLTTLRKLDYLLLNNDFPMARIAAEIIRAVLIKDKTSLGSLRKLLLGSVIGLMLGFFKKFIAYTVNPLFLGLGYFININVASYFLAGSLLSLILSIMGFSNYKPFIASTILLISSALFVIITIYREKRVTREFFPHIMPLLLPCIVTCLAVLVLTNLHLLTTLFLSVFVLFTVISNIDLVGRLGISAAASYTISIAFIFSIFGSTMNSDTLLVIILLYTLNVIIPTYYTLIKLFHYVRVPTNRTSMSIAYFTGVLLGFSIIFLLRDSLITYFIHESLPVPRIITGIFTPETRFSTDLLFYSILISFGIFTFIIIEYILRLKYFKKNSRNVLVDIARTPILPFALGLFVNPQISLWLFIGSLIRSISPRYKILVQFDKVLSIGIIIGGTLSSIVFLIP